QKKQLNVAGAIHGAQHAIMGMLPRFIVAGVDEIQTECKAPEKEFAERQTKRKRPARLIFYDSKGGKYGSGLCVKAFEHIDDIIESSLRRIEECPCSDGCPDCVAASFCKENSLVLSKPGAQVVLHCILGHSEDSFIDLIKDGPEPNMPEIKVETVIPVSEHVNFSDDFKIIDVRRATKDDTHTNEIIKKEI
ncbi:YDR291Wp-like protein, partial [Saccharomyces cerevisiae AWRI1631]